LLRRSAPRNDKEEERGSLRSREIATLPPARNAMRSEAGRPVARNDKRGAGMTEKPNE